jgi:hypothetical protein
MQHMDLNYCEHIYDVGLEYLTGITYLNSLNFKASNAITEQGLPA